MLEKLRLYEKIKNCMIILKRCGKTKLYNNIVEKINYFILKNNKNKLTKASNGTINFFSFFLLIFDKKKLDIINVVL